MDSFFIWVEHTAASVWLRESLSVFAFPTILTLHTVGLAFLTGPNAALDLRLLGFAPEVPLAPMRRFFPIMWSGFWLNAVTGLALMLAYPTKALTNPLFWIKLVLIAAAITVLRRIRMLAFPEAGAEPGAAQSRHLRLLATASLLLWLATITAGRWLAYTYTRLLTWTDV